MDIYIGQASYLAIQYLKCVNCNIWKLIPLSLLNSYNLSLLSRNSHRLFIRSYMQPKFQIHEPCCKIISLKSSRFHCFGGEGGGLFRIGIL